MIQPLKEASSTSTVIAEATDKQRAASDPLISSWVGASAGSGKTKVLTDRILRLLLPREDGQAGTPPDKILAITFTKAGANEMSLRLSRRLSEWAVMDGEKLSVDMENNLFGRKPTPAECEAARKLFARVVDTPGGLKIMTIHSFCQSILGRFPIEAGLNPNFKPLEEEQARELLQEARKNVLAMAGMGPLSPLGQAVTSVSTAMNEEQFDAAITAMIGERHQMAQIFKRSFGVDGLYTNLCNLFGIQAGATDEEALAEFCSMQGVDIPALRTACAALENGKSTDQDKADSLRGFLSAQAKERAAFYPSYRRGFLTTTGGAYKTIATKDVLKAAPQIEQVMLEETERVTAFEEKRKAIACATITRDLFRIGEAILESYQAQKADMGALDFDDLILHTLNLLKGEGALLRGLDITPWIMYKLDEGLDHILVDEAQDTNPEQWEIIRLLSDEFFSGLGARDTVRTLFVVGDEKQSIFSFQRAAPEKFDEMHRYFEKRIRDAGAKFRHIDISTSFRSVQTVLDAVDDVFGGGSVSLGLGKAYLNHIAKRGGQAGLFEVWPIFRGTNGDGEEENPGGNEWSVPDKIVESQSGAAQMAVKIAETIKGWMETGEKLESYARPILPGDIMVLVRARNGFVGQLVRALKTRKIPVSGVDRMVLAEQIVVQDMCAAGAFALLPDDDLTLACLLKSPFVGMDEETLYALSRNRPSTLWDSVKKNGDGVVVAWLEKLIAQAGAAHPYEFFSSLVQQECPADAHSGIRGIRRRLGDDALDPLDEFLNAALTYESSHTSALQGFLKWMDDDSRQIKRELEESGGAVRIMTVHGSKGLQAPIVFLPDTIRTSTGAKGERIFWPHRTGMDIPFCILSKEVAPEITEDARRTIEQKADEEYRRLLYVAMTRAEERLYVGGYIGKRGPGKDSKTAYWYEDIRAAMENNTDIERVPSGIQDKEGNDVPLLRLSTSRKAEPDMTHKNKAGRREEQRTLPGWLLKAAPAEPFPPRPLVPSRPAEAEPAAASPLSASTAYRFKRGTVTHKLLQILPDIAPDKRRIAAEKFLARPAHELPPEIQKDIAAETMAILEDPDFGDIFGAGSMAEIPVTGLINERTLVSGQIDRILVRDKEVLIVDFKTNRPPPQDVRDVSPTYIRQMETYAATLRKIYPGKTVRCALLWTDSARLMEIPV